MAQVEGAAQEGGRHLTTSFFGREEIRMTLVFEKLPRKGLYSKRKKTLSAPSAGSSVGGEGKKDFKCH